jgi:hypothetical protein
MAATTKAKVIVLFNSGEQVVFEDWDRAQKLAEREQGEILAILFDGATGFFGNDFAVLAAGGLNVQVSVGRGYRNASIDETDPDEPIYKILQLEDVVAINLDVADPSNGRIDRIVAKEDTDDRDQQVRRYKDATTDNITNENLYKSRFRVSQIQYLPGVPAGSPVAPDTPDTWVSLCTINIAAAAGSIVQGDINDERVLLTIDPTLVAVTGGTTDHGALTGLLDSDDHPWALLADGTRPLLGNMDVSTGVLIGTMPMRDHHGVGGTAKHPVVTADPGGVAGFMSPADKAKIAQQGATGIRAFGYEHVGNASAKIVPSFSGKVFIDLDDGAGNFATRASNPAVDSGKITFTMPTHLDTGSEAASTWYSFYVHWDSSGGMITPHISATPPNMATSQHPGHSTWIFVGSIYNDASSNFRPQDRFGQLVFFRDAQPDDIFDGNVGASFVDVDCRKACPRSTIIVALAKASSTGSLDNWIYIRAKGDSGPGRKRSPRQGGVDFDTVDANGYAQIKADGSPSCVIGTCGYVETLLRSRR